MLFLSNSKTVENPDDVPKWGVALGLDSCCVRRPSRAVLHLDVQRQRRGGVDGVYNVPHGAVSQESRGRMKTSGRAHTPQDKCASEACSQLQTV